MIHAVAGPFDLGTVVVRAAIKVDPTDSHLTIDTPSLPTILQGIPLRLRTVKVDIDRANFLFNPTNCDQLAVGATLKVERRRDSGRLGAVPGDRLRRRCRTRRR